jgi:hypothetical protein
MFPPLHPSFRTLATIVAMAWAAGLVAPVHFLGEHVREHGTRCNRGAVNPLGVVAIRPP